MPSPSPCPSVRQEGVPRTKPQVIATRVSSVAIGHCWNCAARNRRIRQTSRGWETYSHEVGRLIAEGHEGKFVLIKNETIIGIYDNDDEASDEGRRRYLMQGYLVHQIQTWERVYRTRNLRPESVLRMLLTCPVFSVRFRVAARFCLGTLISRRLKGASSAR